MIDVGQKVSYSEIFQQIKEVYSWLEDEVSKKVFNERLLSNHTKDMEGLVINASNFIQDIMKITNGKHIFNVNFLTDETIIIYGAGITGKSNFEYLKNKGCKKILFCDRNYKEIKNYLGCIVISPEELFEKYSNCKVIIAHLSEYINIHDYLKLNDVKNLIWSIIYDEEGQYFDDVIQFGENETFVDAGVFDGISSIRFAKKCNNKYRKIYLFEPNKDCIDSINDNIKHLNNVELHNIGVWHEKNTLKFNENGQGSSINSVGTIQIDVNSIDNIVMGDEVTFIKLDVEGAELNALKGAKETIVNHKPKLAISLYHKPEDIIELLAYIKFLVPEYKLYVRHYTNVTYETVLYAVI